MQSVKLNLIPGAVLPVVNVSQYDVERTFQLAVYDGAASYDLTGKTVTIRGTKPDNHGFDYGTSDGVVSVSGNTVTISTTQQMTAVGGQVMAELRIESGTTVIGTLNFIIDVEPSALSDETIISDTEIPVIERDFEAALAEAEADALVAEGYAKGTQDGTPVGSGSPYYHDNAKYYKEQAEEAASGVLEKYPKIVGDYWYIWDVDTNQYVNTGVRAKGTQGDPGQGVPAGGTTGQVLKKKSNSDYDCEWGAGGGGGASALSDLTDVTLTSPASGDGLLYDGSKWVNGEVATPAQVAAKLDIESGAGYHNSIYRGKYLGSSVTADQFAAISAGTFDDLYIGDYWTINSVNYRIAAFDYWLGTGNTECTTHHVVIVPDNNLYSAKMNDSSTTTGGYVGSKMYTDNLSSAETTISAAFGAAHILSFNELLVNAETNGCAAGWSFYTVKTVLMNENMVLGHPAWAALTSASGLGYETSIDKGQLPLFALYPPHITNRNHWWLRDIVSSTNFAFISNTGAIAGTYGANTSIGVRPAFGIIG